MSSSLRLAEMAARKAGEILRDRSVELSRVRHEQDKDLKLQADLLAEEAILRLIESESSFPIVSEERGVGVGFSVDFEHWVVDPLDGTLNYGRQIPLTCVSIALWRGQVPRVGVVYDFENDELFAGEVGVGATCNGLPIRVSNVTDTSKAVVATGFPSGRDYGDAALLSFCRKVQEFKKVRLLGSAALSLAWLAAGRLDAYTEDDIWYWDVAAGLALVSAAGGDFLKEPGTMPFQFRVRAHTRGLAPR